MSTKPIKLYIDSETCAYNTSGYYYTEQTYPNGEIEWMRWI